jgi:hypothetical protein
MKAGALFYGEACIPEFASMAHSSQKSLFQATLFQATLFHATLFQATLFQATLFQATLFQATASPPVHRSWLAIRPVLAFCVEVPATAA